MLGIKYDDMFRVTMMEKPSEHYIVMAEDLTEALEKIWKIYPETKGKPYSAKLYYCAVIKVNGVIEEKEVKDN